ncbi:glutamine--fructose-6-phosphate transaminase (isomerizing) (plasmid) [Haloferax mediterranei ATCC 33500]|nr:glutamine--fructose-6-phosphate transaminase (isomerizing) [Haloferax mediterranei]AHZ24647.1 glucosamine-fructose-6-phosphate aminotransferase [Haloferax mediterranei ATCC 33500]MDX5990289.1 glutamine--fructose-6-phosphate transaminase (isomerizing) [Haloferax mediterranei ATCC 33500]QCQ77102.1 glutamine--fructose-6-phosphate transaminase (isomerizing) [Haloferax mediterranei ATCC 33500]
MCGIIAHVGDGRALDPLVTGLEKLEYRGYDSAGIAVKNGTGLDVWKCSGQVSDLKETIANVESEARIGIGHTRWSTHGPPTDENAHPHTDQTDRVAAVHNGIIENYEALKAKLIDEGYEFTSDTDTEVIPNLVDYYLERGNEPLAAFQHTVNELEGSYAIAVVVDENDSIYAARQGSPLVLGVEANTYFLASDVPAFLDHTDNVVYLEDGDTIEVRADGVNIVDDNDQSVQREVEQVDWQPDETGKGQYDHFMLKEIHTQPTSLRKTIEGRVDLDSGSTDLDIESDLSEVETVHLVGCGTSYHAALFAACLLNRCGLSARAIRASEYDLTAGTPSNNTLFVAVTQSGETADTLSALRRANDVGLDTLAVTNVVQSTVAREADEPLYIRAGPEIGVAATKTFSSQAAMLTLLSQHLARVNQYASRVNNIEALLSDLTDLPDAVEGVLQSSNATRLAEKYLDENAYFFIGRGLGCSVAKEGALKFKEITYEHAEGFASGELKHGPLALVTDRTPVFAVCADDSSKTVTNAKEAQTRGAPIIAVSTSDHSIVDTADDHLSIPDMHPVCSNLLANVQLQLLSYYCATELGRAIDKPRNLAKSVTVE